MFFFQKNIYLFTICIVFFFYYYFRLFKFDQLLLLYIQKYSINKITHTHLKLKVEIQI